MAVGLVELLLVRESLSVWHELIEILVEEALASVFRVRPLTVAHALPFCALGARVDYRPRWAGLEASELVSALALVARLYAAPVRRLILDLLFDFRRVDVLRQDGRVDHLVVVLAEMLRRHWHIAGVHAPTCQILAL